MLSNYMKRYLLLCIWQPSVLVTATSKYLFSLATYFRCDTFKIKAHIAKTFNFKATKLKNRIVTADGSVQTEKTVQSFDSFWT